MRFARGILTIVAFGGSLLQKSAPEKLNSQTPMPRIVKPTKPESEPETSRPILTLPAVLNYGGFLFPLGPLCTEQIRLALTNVYRTKGLLDSYELNIEMVDDECSRPVMVRRFLETLESEGTAPNRLPLVLGSFCGGAQYTGTFAKYYNYLALSTLQPITHLIADRRRYDGFYVTTPGFCTHVKAVVAVWKKIGFQQVAILSETLSHWLYCETELAREMATVNMTLLAISKVIFIPGIVVEPADIQRAVEEIARSEARVILIYTNYGSKVACWLHRYGLYGPGYALFMINFSYFTKTDPGRYSPWCTEQMLEEVLRTLIFVGTGEDIDIYGKDLDEDSLGTSGAYYTKYLRDTIDRPERDAKWWAPWRVACYDITVAAAMWLDKTENVLKEQKDTLTNWTVNGTCFKSNATKFGSLMKETITQPRFRTISGKIAIQNSTGANSYGNAPYVFSQVQPTQEAFDLDGSPVYGGQRPFILYAFVSGSKLIETGTKPFWGTYNGLPPRDSITHVTSLEPMVKPSVYIGCSVTAGFLIFVNGIYLVYHSVKQNPPGSIRQILSIFNRIVMVGHVIIVAHIFSLPYETAGDVASKCAISFGLLTIGYFLIVTVFLLKLEVATFLRLSVTNEVDLKLRRKRAKLLLSFLPVGLAIVVVLVIALFVSEPLRTVEQPRAEIKSSQDISLIYLEKQVVCQQSGNGPSIPAIIIGAIFVLAVIRALLICTILKAKPMQRVPDLRQTIFSFGFTLTGIFFAGIVGGVIYANNMEKIAITLSIVSLVVVASNTAMLFGLETMAKFGALRVSLSVNYANTWAPYLNSAVPTRGTRNTTSESQTTGELLSMSLKSFSVNPAEISARLSEA